MKDSAFKKVRLSEIEPNPFRRLDLYPLDKAKIAALRSSIRRTEFWDNVVTRERKGKFQLAYGHHRIQAAREQLGKNAAVRIILRELDDEAMLKMMAADNNDAYNLSPGFILETVDAAKGFITKGKPGANVSTGKSKTHFRVAKFLDWPAARVKDALAQLAAIEGKELSREAVEALPTQHAATTLHREVQKAKKQGAPISRPAQMAIAKRAAEMAETTDVSIPEAIKRDVFEQQHPAPKDAKLRRFEDFVGDTARLLLKVRNNMEKILEFKTDLSSDLYRTTLEANYLRDVSRDVLKQLQELLSVEDHLEQRTQGNKNGENSACTHDPN